MAPSCFTRKSAPTPHPPAQPQYWGPPPSQYWGPPPFWPYPMQPPPPPQAAPQAAQQAAQRPQPQATAAPAKEAKSKDKKSKEAKSRDTRAKTPSPTASPRASRAIDPNMLYGGDARIEIDMTILARGLTRTYSGEHSVCQPPARRLRLISKEFPWSIDLVKERHIRNLDIWYAIYDSLQVFIKYDEWSIILRDVEKANRMDRASRDRLERAPSEDKRMKRIDWLGSAIMFKGLYRDDEYVKNRTLPGENVDQTLTLIVRMGRPRA